MEEGSFLEFWQLLREVKWTMYEMLTFMSLFGFGMGMYFQLPCVWGDLVVQCDMVNIHK